MDFSYQLYSSRNWPLSVTLHMIAHAGYTQVEGYGDLFKDPEKVRALGEILAETGLTMPTAHIGLEMIEDATDIVIGFCAELGIRTIYCPFIPPQDRPKDAQGWHNLGARLQESAAPLRGAGVGFGWHNHDFEFLHLADHSLPQELLFQGGPDLLWEADLAWIVRAAADPVAAIEAFASRLNAVHVKDLAPPGDNPDEDGWADLGQGTIDWPALAVALRDTPVKHYILEHDNPSDHLRFATRSIEAAQSIFEPA